MVTKTDVRAITELHEQYKPASPGILSADESDLIHRILELDIRTDVELQNIRDISVMFYSKITDKLIQNGKQAEAMTSMNAISGICGAIDREKTQRGMPV